jgi:stearoyl-CoA desaturase (delta-9 desaturase)
MTRAERTANLIGVVLPFAGVLAAIILLWNQAVDVTDLAILAVGYAICGFGITIGYHRLLTHRSFQTSDPMRYAFAIAGSYALQGSVLDWVADHRKHHAHTDEEGDPHSPHVGAGAGIKGAMRGLLHAHVGWLMTEHGRAERAKYARDLVEDRGMRFVDRSFIGWVGLGLALPAALGWLITGSYTGALTGLLWGGLVRVFMLHHLTWSINSVCHFFGRRRFATEDKSTNVWWLALPTFGEAWHHNHHAFPRSATHGLGRLELDPSAAVIWTMEKLGLVWDVVRITPERQTQRMAPAAGATPGAR